MARRYVLGGWNTILYLQINIMKNEIKIVVAGNVGSGKSTSIRGISEIPVLATEAKATESDALHRKQTTTVSMDYGIVHVEEVKVHLYGTPGQRRFYFMADILCQGAHGIVFMIDNGCGDPLREIDYYMHQHSQFLQKNPGVIAITHFDDNNTDTYLVDYHAYIKSNGFTCPVMLLDARNPHEVRKVLVKLLSRINNSQTGKKN
jgi:signal recognition particle receptor subunit beta